VPGYLADSGLAEHQIRRALSALVLTNGGIGMAFMPPPVSTANPLHIFGKVGENFDNCSASLRIRV
jgi:hypothetical protein